LAAANRQRDQAEVETALQREATAIERLGTSALRRFQQGQHLDGILAAMQAGDNLRKQAGNAPLSEYRAYSPLFGLQQMLYGNDNRPEFIQQNEFVGHQGSVLSVSFSPDGQQIATAAADGTARLWQVYDLDGLMGLGCDWLRDYLTHHPEASDADRAICNIPPRGE